MPRGWRKLHGNSLALVVATGLILAFALVAFFRALEVRQRMDRFDTWVTLPMLGLLSGWLTAAVFLNTISWLKLAGHVPAATSPIIAAAATLVAATILAAIVLWRAGGYFWYAAAPLWALGGVIVANLEPRGSRDIVMLCAVLALLVVAVLLASWRRGPKET